MGKKDDFDKIDANKDGYISREEYDIQVNLLKKCQDRITELEEKISELENKK